jgi:hypothetical protein
MLIKLLKAFKTAALFMLLVIIADSLKAQAPADSVNIQKMISLMETRYSRLPSEKIFLHFDKPAYAMGDTIWFKAYLLNGATLAPSTLSGKIYVELINDSTRIVDRRVIPVIMGLGEGDFKLDEKIFTEGTYTIRAYTNWMQNFSADALFYKQIYIGGQLADDSWFVNEQHTLAATEKGNTATIGLKLNTPGNQPVTNVPVEIKVMQNEKQLLKQSLATSAEGFVNLNLLIPKRDSIGELSILITETKGKHKLKIPLPANSVPKIDLQFMPEGGNLIEGLVNKIGFKAIGEDGLGVDVSGTIYNNKAEEVNTFASTHKGMGVFSLVPQAGETYTAKVKLANGRVQTFALPKADAGGMVLRVDNIKHPDSLYFYITAVGNFPGADSAYALVAHSVNAAHYGIPFKLYNHYRFLRLAKSALPPGIVNFSVVNSKYHVLAQRRVFIKTTDSLKILATPDKERYQPQDSIALNLKLTNANGKPLTGNLSIAVTDDRQVKFNSYDDNIVSRMLLTSELKGYIEEPSWYFNNNTPAGIKALDNLMLTQGWVGISVADAISSANISPQFEADSAINLSGYLKGFLNKPGKNLKVTLMATGKDVFLMDTISDNEGKFAFKNIPMSDTIAYTLKAHTLKGGTSSAELFVNEFIAPSFDNLPAMHKKMPWYAKTDSTLLNYLNANTANKKLVEKIELGDIKGNLLNTVVVKARPIIGVKGIYGEDLYYADANITEESFKKAGSKTLLDYLKQNVDGFHIRLNARGDSFYMKGNKVQNIFIDGRSVSAFLPVDGGPNAQFNALKQFLETSSADLKRVVIYHYPEIELNKMAIRANIMIITRSGAGPVFRSSTGNYIYRPLPVYTPRQFYQPKYTVKSQPNPLDQRSTIHWEPNLMTDATGAAKLTFYAASTPSTYTVHIQGTDLTGLLGTQTLKIKVEGKQQGN